MTKHIIDQPRRRTGQRLARFLRLSRAAHRAQASRLLSARPRTQAVTRVRA